MFVCLFSDSDSTAIMKNIQHTAHADMGNVSQIKMIQIRLQYAERGLEHSLARFLGFFLFPSLGRAAQKEVIGHGANRRIKRIRIVVDLVWEFKGTVLDAKSRKLDAMRHWELTTAKTTKPQECTRKPVRPLTESTHPTPIILYSDTVPVRATDPCCHRSDTVP
jgi:hypothetical protein